MSWSEEASKGKWSRHKRRMGCVVSSLRDLGYGGEAQKPYIHLGIYEAEGREKSSRCQAVSPFFAKIHLARREIAGMITVCLAPSARRLPPDPLLLFFFLLFWRNSRAPRGVRGHGNRKGIWLDARRGGETPGRREKR